MESLKMPMRQIRDSYTKSELMIMAWRSNELSYNMDKNTPRTGKNGSMGRETSRNDTSQSVDLDVLEQRLGSVAEKMVREDGMIDLRRCTGDEAMRYMAAMGIPITGGRR